MSRRNPLENMQQWFDRMERELADATRRWDEDGGKLSVGGSSPDVDLVERDEEYEVTVDLPGFSKDDVTVRVDDMTLHVDAEATHESEERDEQYLRRERRHRTQSRRVRLPRSVDADEVSATMNNGVLGVTIPKEAAIDEGHSIEIT